jgi:hypothetical protein
MPSKDSAQYFGYVIAYILPGFLSLWVVASFDATAAAWLAATPQKDATVGAFLFAVLASLGLGVFVNGVRWTLLDDWLFKKSWRWANVPKRPELDFSKRTQHADAYRALQEDQFRFAQFYGNAFIALAFVGCMAVVEWASKTLVASRAQEFTYPMAFLFVEVFLFRSCRSCLTKYRQSVAFMRRDDVAA